MLSLYYDGELPSPWKEKLEAHVAACSPCRNRLEQFRLLSGILEEASGLSVRQEQVWQRLNSPAALVPAGRSARVWRRSVPVPLPLAVAAAALILAFGVFFVRSPRPASPADSAIAYSALETMAPVSDLSAVLQYLEGDSPDIVIIHLPESRSFMSSGEPAIIRAADYSGGSRSR
jgi:anti-sigma factor RsiW